MENRPIRIIVHHTADPSPSYQFEKVNAYHRTKFAWPSSLGYFVAYHRFVERDGTVFIARKDDEGGPHTLGYNYAGLAVCMAGDFNQQQPTLAQIAALQGIIEEWRAAYGIALDDINPHRFYNPITDCYGKNLPDDWAKKQAALGWLAILKAIVLKMLATIHL